MVPDGIAEGWIPARGSTAMTSRRGFTLLEVLVVLVITGLLSAVLDASLLFRAGGALGGDLHKITGLDQAVVQRNLFGVRFAAGWCPTTPRSPTYSRATLSGSTA